MLDPSKSAPDAPKVFMMSEFLSNVNALPGLPTPSFRRTSFVQPEEFVPSSITDATEALAENELDAKIKIESNRAPRAVMKSEGLLD
jgi:hypothetical protein